MNYQCISSVAVDGQLSQKSSIYIMYYNDYIISTITHTSILTLATAAEELKYFLCTFCAYARVAGYMACGTSINSLCKKKIIVDSCQ